MKLTKEYIQNIIQECDCLLIKYIKNNYPSLYNTPHIGDIHLTRATGYFAQIKRLRNGTYDLMVSKNIFDAIENDDKQHAELVNTITHELVHTMNKCWNHGPNFKRIANYLNSVSGGLLNITTTTTASDLGLDISKIKKIKYKVICIHCGHEYMYTRKPKHNVADYICSVCGFSGDSLQLVEL